MLGNCTWDSGAPFAVAVAWKRGCPRIGGALVARRLQTAFGFEGWLPSQGAVLLGCAVSKGWCHSRWAASAGAACGRLTKAIRFADGAGGGLARTKILGAPGTNDCGL